MPIEIRELVIRAVLTDTGPGGGARLGADGDAEQGAAAAGAAAIDTEALVQECVRQVLDILARDAER